MDYSCDFCFFVFQSHTLGFVLVSGPLSGLVVYSHHVYAVLAQNCASGLPTAIKRLMLLQFLRWLVLDMVVPLLGNNFYITEVLSVSPFPSAAVSGVPFSVLWSRSFAFPINSVPALV